MKKILRLIKKFFLGFLLFIFILAIGHWAAGYGYIIKGVWYTYLSGKLAPGIDEADNFYNHTIDATEPESWAKHSLNGNMELSIESNKKLEEINSTAFLVVKDGKLAFEKYWDKYDANYPTNSFSAVKSVISLLIGIAIDEGKIQSIKQPVGDFLPEFKSGKKSNITIEHLLTMSSGLDWEESGGNPYSDNARGYFGEDLRSHISTLEVEEEPGKIFRYKSGNTQILGFILKEATGISVSEYLQEKLWTPLHAESDALWNLDQNNGDEKAFCCFYSTPRDFARIGQLILQKGMWEDKRIISEEYLNLCTSPASLHEADGSANKRYGFQWWTGSYEANSFCYARGILGQYIIILPAYNMVIVRTGWERKNVAQDGHPSDVWDHIKAAMELFQ